MANRIKVIASDLDGTLLNSEHKISTGDRMALEQAVKNGIRFIVSTGRSYLDAKKVLKNCTFDMDYVVASGSEVHDKDGRLLKKVYMDQSNFPEIYEVINKYPVAVRFCSNTGDYMIGTEDEVKNYMIQEFRQFFKNQTEEEMLDNPEFRHRMDNLHCIDHVNELRTGNVGVYKIFIFSYDKGMLAKLNRELSRFHNIVSASSFPTNIELTHVEAQKGIALEEYITSLGYKMNEVMVLGDSLNDYSMMSRKFGATVAMANAMDEIKEVAKYQTKSNDENGVAYAVNLMMSGRLDEIRN